MIERECVCAMGMQRDIEKECMERDRERERVCVCVCVRRKIGSM